MIVVRDVFRLKYGQARPALALMKEAKAMMAKAGITTPSRVLTDLVGPAYTLVLESTYPTLTEWEHAGKSIMSNDEWRAWYQRFTPVVDSGYREILTVAE
jgi:hypothetical protein